MDPNFSGSDRDLDPDDLDINGNATKLKNDIFPDDLFTPGTRINLFYKARWEGGSAWSTFPDTAGSRYLEAEVLPSSMDAASQWNCVLYVNHFGRRGGAPIIEEALGATLGYGSVNHEGTNWDRFDVQNPTGSHASLGRPLHTNYGATALQLLGYKCILWNSGDLGSRNLVKEDADILLPWLTLANYNIASPRKLYLSGDGLARSITLEASSDPSALVLLNDLAGVVYNCDTFSKESCPPGTPPDLTNCVNLDPVLSSPVAGARSVAHVAQGNGCPSHRSFDVLTAGSPTFGVAVGDEEYNGIKGAQFASVALGGSGGQFGIKVVTDGVSLHHRRDDGPSCSFQSSGRVAVTERLYEVLEYLGHESPSLCEDSPNSGSVDDPVDPIPVTSLLTMTPNPLPIGRSGVLRFTKARAGHARLDVFDLNGRLVKVLHDAVTPAGETRVTWNGTDGTGRPVASGVYFYRLKTSTRELSKKMVLISNGGS